MKKSFLTAIPAVSLAAVLASSATAPAQGVRDVVERIIEEHGPKFDPFNSHSYPHQGIQEARGKTVALKFTNATRYPVRVAINQGRDEGNRFHDGRGAGWWRIMPGQTVHVANLYNRGFYYYAYAEGANHQWTGPNPQPLRGQWFNMVAVDLGKGYLKYGSHTQTLFIKDPAPNPGPLVPNVAGQYRSNHGVVVLRQAGARVWGSVRYPNGKTGSLSGEVRGGQLVFTWSNAAESGRGVLTVRHGGRHLEGYWVNASNGRRGGWSLRR